MKTITKEDGRKYFCLTDFAKEYLKRYNKYFNVSQSIKNIPPQYIIKSRGRGSKTYIEISVLPIFFNSKRNIPGGFIDECLSIAEIKTNTLSKKSLQGFFTDLLESFLTSMIHDISFEREFALENKSYDIKIGNKILIEYDEYDHKNCEDNDNYKNQLAEANNYKLVRVKSQSDYGYEIANIYKLVKRYYL